MEVKFNRKCTFILYEKTARGEQIHNKCTDYRRIGEIFLTRKMHNKKYETHQICFLYTFCSQVRNIPERINQISTTGLR